MPTINMYICFIAIVAERIDTVEIEEIETEEDQELGLEIGGEVDRLKDLDRAHVTGRRAEGVTIESLIGLIEIDLTIVSIYYLSRDF